jgi:hypothetical protein
MLDGSTCASDLRRCHRDRTPAEGTDDRIDHRRVEVRAAVTVDVQG